MLRRSLARAPERIGGPDSPRLVPGTIVVLQPAESPRRIREEPPMTNAVIVDAVRTPGGKRNGKLRKLARRRLASEALKALQPRNDLDPALIDDVIWGSCRSLNKASTSAVTQSWPRAGPSRSPPPPSTASADRRSRPCTSPRKASMAGAYDIGGRGRGRDMTRTPWAPRVVRDLGYPFGPRMMALDAERGGIVGQGIGAEMIADQWGIYARSSTLLASEATIGRPGPPAEGPIRRTRSFRSPSVTTTATTPTRSSRPDEGIRPDSSVEIAGQAQARRSSPRAARSRPAIRPRSPTGRRRSSS